MMKENLSVNHLLGIEQLKEKDIHTIFATADYFKEVINRPIKKVPTLSDVTIANLFFENSTRTKISFELAEKRLSADVVNFSAGGSSVKKGETLIDTANNILALKVDMIVMRHFQVGAAAFLAKHTKSVIINAGDGTHQHPTQALLDAYSIKEKIGDIDGKKIAIIGDVLHSRVALSNILLLKKLGARLRVCGPPTLIPYYIKKLGVDVSHDIKNTLNWCDVAYVLRVQHERMSIKYFPSTKEYQSLFGIDADMLKNIDKEIILMHPGPINRGVEITSAVADSPQAIVLNQVENGLSVRMACIYLLVQKIIRL